MSLNNDFYLKLFKPRTYSTWVQHTLVFIIVGLLAGICFALSDIIGYKVIALLLLMTVSLLAMLFDIWPVLMAATFTAVLWNYFFIPPIYTFHIGAPDDLLLFLLYFVIASINTVLTIKIRKAENEARDKEEKENTIKLYSTLLNSLSHELRTPIAAILGAVDSLRENKSKLSEIQQEQLLQEIDIASIRLNRQVENLLNMSRLETGMLSLKKDWCDLPDLIYSIIGKLSDGTEPHRIEFTNTGLLPLFKFDVGLIEQVIHNILHNAIQYTPANTTISITVEPIANGFIIMIADEGTGFHDTEKPRAFEKFYRLPNTKSGGSGLGLSIVKGFVEAHGGSVSIENNTPQGARFKIFIPCEVSYLSNLKNE